MLALALVTARGRAGAGARRARRSAAEKQVVFPAGSEEPLAALQDIDVIEHLGEQGPGGARRSPTRPASR